MTKSQLKKLIKEQIKLILEADTYLASEIYDNDYKIITISLKYASKAQRIFNDSFKNKAIGTQEYTDSYEFKSTDDAADFVITLVNAGIPEDEIELS